MEDFGTQIFWMLGRGTGVAAIVLAGLSVTFGLLAGRDRPLRLKALTEKKEFHEALSMATIVAIIAHGLFLFLDPWLSAGVSGILVPFTMDYRPFFSGLGIIAGYGMVLLGLSYYARKWIGASRWRIAHRFVALFWILGLVHTFGAGTDAGELWLQIPVALTSIPALVLLVATMAKRRRSGRKPKAAVSGNRATASETKASPTVEPTAGLLAEPGSARPGTEPARTARESVSTV